MSNMTYFLQIIELQLPSFFNNFDPRAAAANFPSSKPPSTQNFHGFLVIKSCFLYLVTKCSVRCTSISSRSHIRTCCLTL